MLSVATLLALGSTSAVSAADEATPAEPAEPASPPLRLGFSASPGGMFRMVLTNEGSSPLRIAADGRLLWLEVVSAPEPPPSDKEKGDKEKGEKDRHPTKAAPPKAFPSGKMPLCKMPPEMRPDTLLPDRALILEPGERYEETIDPVALCGAGAVAAGLGAGAIVYPHYGFPETRRPAPQKKGAKPEKPRPPYIAEGTKLEDETAIRSIDGTPIVLGPMDEPPDPSATGSRNDAPHGDDPVDERAPRLTLDAPARVDAGSAEDITVTLQVANVGKRKAIVHLRTDDLAFTVVKPTGETAKCNPSAGKRAVARDFFETLAPDAHRAMTVRVRELCAQSTFDRPGVYLITPRLALREGGDQFRLAGFLGTVRAAPMRLRVRTGKLPYYPSRPRSQGEKKKPEPTADEPAATPAAKSP
jgi:hypothetical protein